MANMTVADVRRMLNGEPAQATPVVPVEAIGPMTVETVVEQPMLTTETVEIVESPPVGGVPRGKSR